MLLAVGFKSPLRQQVELRIFPILLLCCDKWILRPSKWQLKISRKQLGVRRLLSLTGGVARLAG